MKVLDQRNSNKAKPVDVPHARDQTNTKRVGNERVSLVWTVTLDKEVPERRSKPELKNTDEEDTFFLTGRRAFFKAAAQQENDVREN